MFPSLGGDFFCRVVLEGPYFAGTTPFLLWAYAFALTFVIETAFLAFSFRRIDQKLVFASLSANLLTHPATIYLWIPFAARTLDLSTRSVILGAELTIPWIEFWVYYLLGYRSWKLVLVAVALANFLSWTLVVLIG